MNKQFIINVHTCTAICSDSDECQYGPFVYDEADEHSNVDHIPFNANTRADAYDWFNASSRDDWNGWSESAAAQEIADHPEVFAGVSAKELYELMSSVIEECDALNA